MRTRHWYFLLCETITSHDAPPGTVKRQSGCLGYLPEHVGSRVRITKSLMPQASTDQSLGPFTVHFQLGVLLAQALEFSQQRLVDAECGNTWRMDRSDGQVHGPDQRVLGVGASAGEMIIKDVNQAL